MTAVGVVLGVLSATVWSWGLGVVLAVGLVVGGRVLADKRRQRAVLGRARWDG